MSASEQPSPKRSRKGRFWMLFPFGLLGVMLLGWGFMVSIAVNDPGFSVEEDYYEKAVGWDEHQAQAAKNDALGWKLSTRFESSGGDMKLFATLTDQQGAKIRGARVAVRTFHVARGQNVVEGTLSEGPAGEYSAVLSMRRPGIWEMRFTVEHEGETFTIVRREELMLGGPR